jgi:DNA-binding NarL/FixJ family response regulator
VVADDQASFRRAAAAVIDQVDEFELVGAVDSGESAVALVEDQSPELVLLDINMPGIGGLRAAEVILARQPEVQVVLVSTYDSDALPAVAWARGISYLHKEALSPEELIRLWSELRRR